jgi:microcystin-dependent protein
MGGLAVSKMFGTVAAVNAGPPPTVNVYLNNNSTGAQPSTANKLSYMSDYNPVVGDAVLIFAGQAGLQTSYVVMGTLSGASAGGGSSGVPIGAIQMFPVAITYANWLLCNGGTFSAVTYPVLNTLLGGNTLPNLQGVAPMGAGANGITLGTRNATGESEAHAHTGAAHTHTGAAHVHTHSHGSGGPHSHSHNHSYNEPVSAGTPVVLGAGINALTISAGVNTGGDATATDPGPVNPDSTSTTPGAGGPASAANTGPYGSGTANIPPNLGVAYYIKAA